MKNVLLVEDSPEIFHLVRRALGATVQLEWGKSLREAKSLLQSRVFDLILLDIVLPDGEGYEICSLLRSEEHWARIPVIFLTAKNSVSDKVMGFSIGGDDFIVKPFDLMELKARVESKLRRLELERSQSEIARFGEIEINKATQKVLLHKGSSSSEVELTPIEYKMLLFLSREPGKVFGREEILNAVWGETIHVYNRSVDTHISKLRKKLATHADYVESVHGIGYRFVIREPAPVPLTRPSETALPTSSIY